MLPLTKRAQTTRAILLARATVTSIFGLRGSICASHDPAGAPRRQACRITALAPRMSKRRMVRSPRFDTAPSFCLPPVDFCRGVSPSQAAKSRPARKFSAAGTSAVIAVAVIGPTRMDYQHTITAVSYIARLFDKILNESE